MLAEAPRPGHVRTTLRTAVKILMLPFRFAWLLIVWLRLRLSAAK